VDAAAQAEGEETADMKSVQEIVDLASAYYGSAVLFAATIGVAIYSRADMISSMCLLMSRGAVISIFAVPLFLAPMLIFTDPLVIRTTLGMKKLIKEKK